MIDARRAPCTNNAYTYAILSYIKKDSDSAYRPGKDRARYPRNDTSSRTNAARPFSSMTVHLSLANLLKNVNSTMFILAVCGRRLFPESRIVGGSRSSFGKWPWQVSLQMKEDDYTQVEDTPELNMLRNTKYASLWVFYLHD